MWWPLPESPALRMQFSPFLKATCCLTTTLHGPTQRQNELFCRTEGIPPQADPSGLTCVYLSSWPHLCLPQDAWTFPRDPGTPYSHAAERHGSSAHEDRGPVWYRPPAPTAVPGILGSHMITTGRREGNLRQSPGRSHGHQQELFSTRDVLHGPAGAAFPSTCPERGLVLSRLRTRVACICVSTGAELLAAPSLQRAYESRSARPRSLFTPTPFKPHQLCPVLKQLVVRTQEPADVVTPEKELLES